MNRKGFSLVELIAMVVLLGILMIIVVPNIAGILKNNRENAAKEDVNKMVANAKNRINTKKAQYPKYENSCVVMTLTFIDINSDLKNGLNSGTYNHDESFVVIRKEREDSNTFSYKYYTRLVEDVSRTSGIQKYEIPLTESHELTTNSKEYLKNLPPSVEGNMATASYADASSIISGMGLNCSSIEHIYTS